MKKLKQRLIIVFLCGVILGCSVNAKEMKVPGEEKVTGPQIKITRFAENLKDFGLMLEIYRPTPVKLVLKDITDKTGASASTGAEIQQNITEISKSTLNSMGENVISIDYDPEFVANMQATGYSDFSNKLKPSVVVTGAITEFDRALVSWEKGTDVGAEGDVGIAGPIGKALPSKTLSLDASNSEAQSTARITVDFNMKDFETLASIPGMTTTNSMEVNKGMAKKEVALTLFGPTFGANGSMKKVQGRHDAIRLLVQSSLLQLIGKRAGVPYWRVLGNDTIPDDGVIKDWKRQFPRLDGETQIYLLQRYLNLHGYDVAGTKVLDAKTKSAFADFCSKNKISSNQLDADTFLKIYLTVPLSEETYDRARAFDAGQNLGQAATPDIGKIANMMTEAYGYFKNGNYQAAAQKFEETLKISPTPVAYYFIALSYSSMKDDNKAISSLETGTKTFNDFVLWKALGLSYNGIGDKTKAKQAFSAASAINPNDKQVKFFLEGN